MYSTVPEQIVTRDEARARRRDVLAENFALRSIDRFYRNPDLP